MKGYLFSLTAAALLSALVLALVPEGSVRRTVQLGCGLLLALTALGGGGLAAAALLALWRYDFVAKKQFGGITGDLAGWFLQRAELWMLAALAVSQWGGVL